MSYRPSPRRREESKKGAQVTVTVAVELDWDREKATLLREIRRLRGEVGLMATRYEDSRKEIMDMVTRLSAQSPPPVPVRTGSKDGIEPTEETEQVGSGVGGGERQTPVKWQEIFKPNRDMSRTLNSWESSGRVEEEIKRCAREWEDMFRQYCSYLNKEGKGGEGTKAWNGYSGEEKWDAQVIEWWNKVVKPHMTYYWNLERFDRMCWRAHRMAVGCEIVKEGTDLVFRSKA